MPAPLARGIIITVSVLVAAGIAAYESPAVREWIEKSREKIAIALHSLGDDIHPRRPGSSQDDPSMREEQSEKAEEKRRQMREEIMEKGRRLEERMRRKQTQSEGSEKRSPSFDSMVDGEGMLKPLSPDQRPAALASGVEATDASTNLRSRHVEAPEMDMHRSVDAPMLLRQLDGPQAQATEPWESQYEREMRNTWHLPLPQSSMAASSHASESLLDLTPTTEDIPDPAMSIPSVSDHEQLLGRTGYFSAPSRSSHTVSEASEPEYYYAHPSQPLTPLEPRPVSTNMSVAAPESSAASVAGSMAHVHASDLESEDDFSEFGDGVRTPASAWTEVGSTVSADD